MANGALEGRGVFVFGSGSLIFFDCIVGGPLHGEASWRFVIAVGDLMSHITLNIWVVEIKIYLGSHRRAGRKALCALANTKAEPS